MGALAAALLSQKAYSAAPDIGQADSASRAIVRHTDAGLVVAFRGSDDIESWLHDLDAIPRIVPGMGVVHAGFYAAWEAIAPQVVAAIGDQPVTFVGHSLGAAMALLAAGATTLAGKPPVTVWAFEPPRASFDLALRVLLRNVPLHLFRNGSDPVTDLPLGGMHPGLLTHIGRPAMLVPILADHLIENVIRSLPAA